MDAWMHACMQHAVITVDRAFAMMHVSMCALCCAVLLFCGGVQESFDPIQDIVSGQDLLPCMVMAETLGEWDFQGMHIIMLRQRCAPCTHRVRRACTQAQQQHRDADRRAGAACRVRRQP